MSDLIADSVEQLFAACCSPKRVRAIEDGADSAELWQELTASGYLDALVPEANGGAGLSLRDAFPVLLACGRHALPLPFAQTMLARAILAQADSAPPPEPIAIAVGARESSGDIICRRVTEVRNARWVLVEIDAGAWLLPTDAAQVSNDIPRTASADLSWSAAALTSRPLSPAPSLLPVLASLLAAQIAGAMARVFQLTLDYANARVQFGRPISKFQAIQHQISVMAEQCALAETAARMACASDHHLPDSGIAAIAKAVASEAVVKVNAIAHAVHAAIGVTEEYDLQLYTRRLHEWRVSAGSEGYWNARVGTALLARTDERVLDFLLQQTLATTKE